MATLGALLGTPRPTVISFWATWCAPCLVEGGHLSEIRTRHAPDQLAILGINIDMDQSTEKLDRFRRKAPMTYDQALGDKALYAAFTGSESIALPRLYVFDREGNPTHAFGRFFSKRTLRAIDAAVARVV